MCSGLASFRTYSVMIALDGLVRVALAGAFLVVGIDRVGPYALMVALVPLAIAVTVFATGRMSSDDGSPATWGELAPNLGWLLVGTLFAGALINAGPLTVDILGASSDPAQVTRFANAVLLARVPLFLFQAVQAAMLPRLTRLAALRDAAEFRLRSAHGCLNSCTRAVSIDAPSRCLHFLVRCTCSHRRAPNRCCRCRDTCS
ncbi:MAG: hypothetical protein EBV17_06155 [Actinobacteria bacterium]|nr:hypothetical protein [Actinomycetota bacterium]